MRRKEPREDVPPLLDGDILFAARFGTQSYIVLLPCHGTVKGTKRVGMGRGTLRKQTTSK